MANETYNVFELTNALIRESREKEAQSTDKKVRPTVKESVSGKKVRSKKARKPFEIPFNKLKLESLSMFKEADGDDDDDVDAEVDVTADYTPEDDVVLVIDPEMEEVPEDAAIPWAQVPVCLQRRTAPHQSRPRDHLRHRTLHVP